MRSLVLSWDAFLLAKNSLGEKKNQRNMMIQKKMMVDLCCILSCVVYGC